MADLIKWDDLTNLKQEEILRVWVEKISMKPEICGSEFLSIGVGIREKNMKFEKQLCLKFVVKNKVKPLSKGMQGIRPNIAAEIDLNEKKVKVLIPTDVEDIFSGEAQSDV